ncbi:uncharacterized protein LOC130794802 isoform X1 [Actinidia eriantha]|uniref:uncharacterized protein LOC130794802 isoform X1 n=1 Tax=Actinidia eriantha TaxID=165200 RepID=UPI0025842FC2|nr:uncharacterized protein LOC130794802 isoform X1 [Actinidia eriantha]
MFGGKARRLITIVISVIKKKIQWRIGIKRLWRRLWSPRKRSITRINLLRLIYSGSIDATTLLGGESRKESNGALTEEDSIAMSPTNKVLNSGKLDMDYLGKILECALTTLQKLSTPATEDELKAAHLSMLKELVEICQTENYSDHLHSITLINLCIFIQFVFNTICELQYLRKKIFQRFSLFCAYCGYMAMDSI